MSTTNKPSWIAEVEAAGLAYDEWQWDEYSEGWEVQCYDSRYDGSHDVWLVTEDAVRLECGSVSVLTDRGGSIVATMRALVAAIDAFNLSLNAEDA